VVDSKDGSIVGKVEAIGPNGTNAAVEQGVSDGEGHLYFDVANAHHIAVVDAKTLKVTGHFDLGEKGNGPAGLAIDTKNHILFAMCRGGRGGTDGQQNGPGRTHTRAAAWPASRSDSCLRPLSME
jgi:hypothetical protein